MWALTSLVDEMKAGTVDVGVKMREPVDAFFLRSPVEVLSPIPHKAFQVAEVRTVAPVRTLDFIRLPRVRKTLPKVVDHFLRDVDLEGLVVRPHSLSRASFYFVSIR